MDKWIVCLKHGDKYSSDYVNKLYNMTQRHCNIPFKFACITENNIGINPNIQIIPTPKAKVSGWWYKPWLFSKDIPLSGTLLFFDLDIVIVKNIDQLWSYYPGEFCIIRDFNRVNITGFNRFNSSVFRLEKGSLPHVWDNLANNWRQSTTMHGDQDWIFRQIKSNYKFWPEEWIQSYKWEIRSRTDIIIENNKRKFKDIITPKIKNDTAILVFHGDPKPEEVKDPIIVDNWQ